LDLMERDLNLKIGENEINLKWPYYVFWQWASKKQISLNFAAKKLPRDVKPEAVFACNELDLSEVSVYGFDYDYTLACYKTSLDDLLYDLGKQNLINKFKVSFSDFSIIFKNVFIK